MSVRRNRFVEIRFLSFLVGALGIAGTLLAQIPHPVVSKETDRRQWHLPQGGAEAIFTGDGSSQTPTLVIRKGTIAQSPLTLRVTTDAQRCVIQSGGFEVAFAVTPGKTTRLTLDGSADPPRLLIDGSESPALRGHWIRLALQSQQDTLSLAWAHATYATIRFGDPEPQIRRYVATEPGGPLTLVQEEDDHPAPVADDSGLIRDDAGLPLWRPFVRAGVDFMNAYFYHGIGQEDDDLVVQPWTEVTINMVQDDVFTWLDGVDFRTSARSSHHFGNTGNTANSGREKFYELDFRGEAIVRFLERWSVAAAYMFRVAINNRFNDVQQLEFTLAFDDHDPAYGFKLSPYALVILEVEGESDAGNRLRGPFKLGTLLELGIRPRFDVLQIANRPLTVAVPVKVGISLDDYFEGPDGEDGTFGYVDLGVEVSYPVLLARSDGNRRFAVNLLAGMDVLFLGNSAQDISDFNGTGGDSVELIGKFAVTMEY